MQIEEAMRVTDMFSGSLRIKDGISENHILGLAKVINEFELEKEFPAVRNLYRSFERDPRDKVVGDALARRLRKIFEYYLLEDNDPFIPRPSNGEVDGVIETAKTATGSFGRSLLEATEHQLIVGRSGVGKTNIQLLEFETINRLGGRCIVFTVKTTFRRFIKRFPTLVIRCGAPDDKFKSNPFEIPPGIDNTQARNLIVRAIADAEDMYVGSQNYIAENLAALQDEKYKISLDNHPTFRDLLNRIKNEKPQYSKDPRRVGYRGSALDRFQPIYDSMKNQFDCIKGFPLEDISQKYNIVVEGHRLDPFARHLVFCIYLNRFLSSILATNPRQTKLRHYVMIEEGDSLFNIRLSHIRDPLLFGYFRLVREFGVGFCIDTQTPAMLDQRVFSNTYTKILLGLTDGISIKRCVDSWGFGNRKQIEDIYSLGVGEGIVRFGRYPHLFKIQTEKYNLDENVTEEDVTINNKAILANYSYIPLPLDVSEVTNEAPEPNKRKNEPQKPKISGDKIDKQQIKNTKIDLTDDEKKVLVDIYTRPYESATSKLRSLGFSGSVGSKLKKSLIDKGYVAEYPIKLGHGKGKRGKILVLLDKAESAIEPAKRIKYGRAANLYHSFIQQILKQHFENLWNLKAEIEMVKNGKSADIGIITNEGTYLASEFDNTVAHVSENIKGNFQAGFSKIISVCDNQKVLKQINEIIEKEFQAHKENITVCLLSDVLLGLIEI